MKRRRFGLAVLLIALTLSAGAQEGGVARYRVQLADHVIDTAEAAAQILAICRCRQEPYAEVGFTGMVVIATPSAARLIETDPRVAALEVMAEEGDVGAAPPPAAEATPRGSAVITPRVEPNATSKFNGLGQYTYDGSGNVRQVGSSVYEYDAFGRIVSGTVLGRTQAYQYDRYGNITSKTTDNTASPISVNAATNQMASASYDIAGRLRSVPGVGVYTYDSLDMMTGSTSGPTRRLYVYNASDERIVAYDVDVNGAELASEWTLRDPSGAVLRRFLKGGSGAWSWDEDYVYRDGQMLAAEVAGPARTLHFHLDHLGTPRLITNAAGGFVSEHAYFPFGEEVTTPSAGVERKKFTGHERDHSGLDYMHARYYRTEWGRFLSVDPAMDLKRIMREPQRWNRYSYVVNNPANKVDPDGRQDPVEGLMLGPGSAQHWGLSEEEDHEGWGKAAEWAGAIFAFASGAGEVAGLVRGAASLSTALVPVGTRSLGRWGEARLAQVLGNAGFKPNGAFSTSLGKRFIDRLVNGVAHEAKGGLNVKLTSALERQMMKDAELVATGQVRAAHWHFFRGVKQEVLDKLKEYGIKYTVH